MLRASWPGAAPLNTWPRRPGRAGWGDQRPRQARHIVTDHGPRFRSGEAEAKRRTEAEFRGRRTDVAARHVLARVRRPRADGKLGRPRGKARRWIPQFGATLARTADPTDPFAKRCGRERRNTLPNCVEPGPAAGSPETGASRVDGRRGCAGRGGTRGPWLARAAHVPRITRRSGSAHALHRDEMRMPKQHGAKAGRSKQRRRAVPPTLRSRQQAEVLLGRTSPLAVDLMPARPRRAGIPLFSVSASTSAI